jgi:regulator of RNase E activity RraA
VKRRTVGDVAEFVRSKNAGPFWQTLDVSLPDDDTYRLVRDLPDVEAIGFRLLARGVGVAQAWVAIEKTDVPVDVAGAAIVPGDVIHADRHGSLVIPREALAALPDAAEAVIEREARGLGWVRSGAFDPREIQARRAQP